MDPVGFERIRNLLLSDPIESDSIRDDPIGSHNCKAHLWRRGRKGEMWRIQSYFLWDPNASDFRYKFPFCFDSSDVSAIFSNCSILSSKETIEKTKEKAMMTKLMTKQTWILCTHKCHQRSEDILAHDRMQEFSAAQISDHRIWEAEKERTPSTMTTGGGDAGEDGKKRE